MLEEDPILLKEAKFYNLNIFTVSFAWFRV